jgi:hypothetical protein
MADVDLIKLEEYELPTLFGLWQLIPTQDPVEKIKPDSQFFKNVIHGFEFATIPLLYLFFWNKEPQLYLYDWVHKFYIAFVILVIPGILFGLYTYQSVDLRKSTIMVGVWMCMFALLVLLYGFSKNVA